MADVYKQSFKQNYHPQHRACPSYNCGLERCGSGQTWVPASGTTTLSIWSSRARACSRSAGAPTRSCRAICSLPAPASSSAILRRGPAVGIQLGRLQRCLRPQACGAAAFHRRYSRPPHPGPGGDAGGPEQHLLFPRPAAPGRGRMVGYLYLFIAALMRETSESRPPQHLFFQPVCPERHQVHPVQLLPRHLHRRCRQERRRLPEPSVPGVHAQRGQEPHRLSGPNTGSTKPASCCAAAHCPSPRWRHRWASSTSSIFAGVQARQRCAAQQVYDFAG